MRRLSYSNVTATLALFIALGLGGAYAADKIGSKDIAKNAVKSKHIKNKDVKARDLAPGAVDSATVADGSLLEEDFLAGQLPQGEQGPKGDPATRLFAVVNGGNGNLNSGSGVVSASRTGTGNYTVVFDRSLAGCAAVATAGTGNPSSVGDTTQAGSTATADMHPSLSGNVNVQTTGNGGGGLADRSFHLAVFC